MEIYLVESHFHSKRMEYMHQFLVVADGKSSCKRVFEKEKFKLPPNARITKFDKRKSFYCNGSLFRGYQYLEMISKPHVIETEIYV